MKDSLVTTHLRRLLVLLFAFTLLSLNVQAQSGGSTVRGTVTDPQGNVVAGATVNLTNPEKNFTRTQSTNQEGVYVFTAIPPGTYKLDVEAPGFKTASATGLLALVDTPIVRDVQLEVGAVSETIVITSGTEA